MRAESEQLKRTGRDYPDVDTGTALAWLDTADAPVLVHGHTHKPATTCWMQPTAASS
jgi:UDP-2,3-diacylglucosamine hydrolase